jgi:hypothetical protein
MLRFAQRVERRPLSDDHNFSEDERADLHEKVLDLISTCRFYAPDRLRLPVPHQDVRATYAYDGTTCCIIKRGWVKTIIILDEQHRAALNEHLAETDGS